jgi:multiple sugar transport system substrate-binding protein
MVDAAKKLTQFEGDKMTVAGWRIDLSNQDHSLYREVLIRAYGGVPQSEDHKTIQWNTTPGGYEAWQYLVDLTKTHKVSEPTIGQDGPTAWLAQQAAMMVSGSFYLGTAEQTHLSNTACSPPRPGQANFGLRPMASSKATGSRQACCAGKILSFTSPEVMRR